MIKRVKLKMFSFHAFCLLISVISIYPILWLLKSSLTESNQVFMQTTQLIPDHWEFSNYLKGWTGIGGISFATFFGNTIFITVVRTFGILFSSALVAYGISRIKFRGRKLVFSSMIVSMLLPSQVTMVSSYILFYKIGWVNTYLPLIVPGWLGSPFHIFLLMQFCRSLPRQLDEAATIDGCNNWSIFTRILLPLMGPPLVTAGIFAFYFSWNDFMGPLLYLSQARTFPLSMALRLFADPESVTDWGAMFSMQFLSIIPCLLVFFIFQKRIVEGIQTTGLKG